jgi:hypothetical protein
VIVASMLWRRLDTPGRDACRLEKTPSGWTLRGAAVFRMAGEAANLSYSVDCDGDWKTVSGRIAGAVGGRAVDDLIVRENGGWRLNGDPTPGLESLDDLDLSFTPATNVLQLRRVELPTGRPIRLPAAWFDPETRRLSELQQIYERRDALSVYYRAPGVGYEGLLELAPNGFIRLYPGLWEAE